MDKALQTMINNMPEKTGKSLEEWKKILTEKAFEKHGSLSKENNDTDIDLVANQYKGKESLKPIHDKLISVVGQFGNDITITPKKTSVSIIRKRQFALIKPATKTRIDLGLKLKDKPTTDRLGNSGPFGTMCTHRVQLTNETEIDQELTNWLKEAYEASI